MRNLSAIAVAAFLLLSCNQKKATTQKKPDPSSKKGAPTIASKVKGCKKIPGLFTLYQDTAKGNAYLVINKNQLDQEFIYFAYTENGVIQAGHHRGSYRDNQIFRIRKRYDDIEFVKENTSFYFDSSSALYRSKDANISESILISEDIIARDRDSLFLISADKVFLSEALSRVKPPQLPGAGLHFSLGGLNPKKTRYSAIRSYKTNTDVVVEYVYDNPNAFISGGQEVTDPRSVSIKYQHSFMAVPENNFVPRKDDPRIGFFNEQVNDMTSYSATPYRDVIHRWNLVKKNPDQALSEPVKPITWWIENTTPVKYRETIRKAALKWNIAFEKAGFKNAIEVKIQPDTAEWDAGDIEYNVLRWTSSPNPPFGGYGPSFVNPRTGEILGADIMLEFVFLTNRLNQFDAFTTAGINGFDNGEEGEEAQLGIHNPHQCAIGAHIQHNTQLGMAAIKSLGHNDPIREEFIEQAIHYLILHEMGHTLGLMHNMKASNIWLPSEIDNTDKTREIGLIGSVMDYPAININPQHKNQGDFYTTRPGPYDLWAIEYAYSPSLDDPAKEEARLNSILARSTDPLLTFGNDADDMRAPGKGIDPRVMIFDISGDAVTYSAERIRMLNAIIPKLQDEYTTEGEGYQELLQAYLTVSTEISRATSIMSRYIGGVYVERSVVGQEGAKTPYTPVPADYQKKAMRELNALLFAPDAFDASEGLYKYLQKQRRGFNFFVNTEDPKVYERVENIQAQVLSHILHFNTLNRVTNSELYGNTYSVAEIMKDLETGLFDADMNGSVNTFRMNSQKMYVEALIAISTGKIKDRYNTISQAAAYSTLRSIQAKLKAAGNRGNLNTQAHRAYLYYTIGMALDKN